MPDAAVAELAVAATDAPSPATTTTTKEKQTQKNSLSAASIVPSTNFESSQHTRQKCIILLCLSFSLSLSLSLNNTTLPFYFYLLKIIVTINEFFFNCSLYFHSSAAAFRFRLIDRIDQSIPYKASKVYYRVLSIRFE